MLVQQGRRSFASLLSLAYQHEHRHLPTFLCSNMSSEQAQAESDAKALAEAVEKKSSEASAKETVHAAAEQKTPQTETGDDSHTGKRSREESVPDLAEEMGYKAGDRIEVEWDIATADNDEAQTRWWGATLMPWDGDTTESVAVRKLDYDPYPDGGFPNRSQERVVFTGVSELVDPTTRDTFTFRKEGGEETLRVSRDDIETIVNETLMKALKNNEQSWNNLDRAKQGMLAEIIERKKRKLTELLSERTGKGIVTANDMKTILAQTMEP